MGFKIAWTATEHFWSYGQSQRESSQDNMCITIVTYKWSILQRRPLLAPTSALKAGRHSQHRSLTALSLRPGLCAAHCPHHFPIPYEFTNSRSQKSLNYFILVATRMWYSLNRARSFEITQSSLYNFTPNKYTQYGLSVATDEKEKVQDRTNMTQARVECAITQFYRSSGAFLGGCPQG
jgi:hypothetical protein